ncbi:MAG TPA: cell division protein ZapA [Myxococcota bacterium]|nr:cell division protein ZapA [Myxococcota bacterium]
MSEPVRHDPATATSMNAAPVQNPRTSGKDLVSLTISGRELRIRSDEPVAHLEALARYVEERLTQIAGPKKVEGADPNLLLITALQLADEVFKLRHQQQELAARLRQSSRSLLGRLEGRPSAEPSAQQPASLHPKA